jgi:hypothetical protein
MNLTEVGHFKSVERSLKFITIPNSYYLRFIVVVAGIVKALPIDFSFNNHGV